MKINFKEFELVMDLSGKTVIKQDMREEVGNIIYQNAGGIKALDLAMKIYKSDGETEFSDDEVTMLQDYFEEYFKCMALASFRRLLDKGKEG